MNTDFSEWQEFFTDIFGKLWSIFTQTQVPCLPITFAQLFLGIIGCKAFIMFLKNVLGLDPGIEKGD